MKPVHESMALFIPGIFTASILYLLGIPWIVFLELFTAMALPLLLYEWAISRRGWG